MAARNSATPLACCIAAEWDRASSGPVNQITCRLVGWIKLYDARQPTDCSGEELEMLLKPLDSVGAAKSGTPKRSTAFVLDGGLFRVV